MGGRLAFGRHPGSEKSDSGGGYGGTSAGRGYGLWLLELASTDIGGAASGMKGGGGASVIREGGFAGGGNGVSV